MRIKSFLSLIDKIKEKRPIFSAQIGLTNRCNERCIHCLVCRKPAMEMSEQKLKNTIIELKALNCIEVSYTGGEAMLRKDFFKILCLTKEKGIGIRLLSNGTLINKSNIKQLKEIAPLNIQVSLYGMTARTHDFTTRLEGSFEKTMHAIRLFKENKIRFSVAMMVMNHNFDEVLLVKNMAERERWKILFDFIIRPMDSGSKAPLKTRVTSKQLEKAYCLSLLPFSDGNGRLRLRSRKDLCVNNIGRRHVYISPKGEVFPDIDLLVKIGDLKKNALRDIWFNSKKINWLLNLSLSDFECSRCEFVFRCFWSPGLALMEHDDLFRKPREFCRFTKFIESRKAQMEGGGTPE